MSKYIAGIIIDHQALQDFLFHQRFDEMDGSTLFKTQQEILDLVEYNSHGYFSQTLTGKIPLFNKVREVIESALTKKFGSNQPFLNQLLGQYAQLIAPQEPEPSSVNIFKTGAREILRVLGFTDEEADMLEIPSKAKLAETYLAAKMELEGLGIRVAVLDAAPAAALKLALDTLKR